MDNADEQSYSTLIYSKKKKDYGRPSLMSLIVILPHLSPPVPALMFSIITFIKNAENSNILSGTAMFGKYRAKGVEGSHQL